MELNTKSRENDIVSNTSNSLEEKLRSLSINQNEYTDAKLEPSVKHGYKLNYHFHAISGWINDPNGVVFFRGEYHMFFQYYPYEAHWGPIHWGHATSKDLIAWKMLPYALEPTEVYESDSGKIYGCASGCALLVEDGICLFYTGLHHDKQVQCLAFSRDGFRFEKYELNPIIDHFPIDGSSDFRDPHVWKHDDCWYMALGTKKNGNARVVLYESINFRDWVYAGVLLKSAEHENDMWECPDIAHVGEKQLLLVSPIINDINGKPLYFLGEMNYASKRFEVHKKGTLDYGNDFYAPKSFIDEQGRTILIAWMENWLSHKPTQRYGWAGAFTIPRELVVNDDGILKQRPITELQNRRACNWKIDSCRIAGEEIFEHVYADCMEFSFSLDVLESTASAVAFQIRASADFSECTEIRIDIQGRTISVDRSKSGIGDKEVSIAPFRVINNKNVFIRILTDTSSLEVFVNDGEQVITNRIYPSEESKYARLVAIDGVAHLDYAETWVIC